MIFDLHSLRIISGINFFLDKSVDNPPSMCKEKVDLYKVFQLVVQKGGAVIVTKCRLWTAIVSDLGFPVERRTDLCAVLRDQ